jgi:hypothetical protein
MAKIKITQGSKPILILAPHGGGPTDLRTAKIAQNIILGIDAYGVVNTGWVRPWVGHQEGTGKKHNGPIQEDLANGIANLNDLNHCRQKPLVDDFLGRIDSCVKAIKGTKKRVNIFVIHGMDDTIRDYKGHNMILGYGNGTPPRYSCSDLFKERFGACLADQKFIVGQGKPGGRLSAWNQNNLNQLYSNDGDIFSIQLEIGLTLRDVDDKIDELSAKIAAAIKYTVEGGSIKFLKTIPEF